jgi:hypothetical protein
VREQPGRTGNEQPDRRAELAREVEKVDALIDQLTRVQAFGGVLSDEWAAANREHLLYQLRKYRYAAQRVLDGMPPPP